MTLLARLDERERLIAALVAMCLLAGLVALAMHEQLALRSAPLEQGSLAAPITGDQLHEVAGAGAAPPDVVAGTDGAESGNGGTGGGGGSGSPGTTPPNEPPQPPEGPPPDDNLISQILAELPELPPPLLRNGLRFRGGR